MSTKSTTQRYRPSLTAVQIAWIVTKAKTELPISDTAFSVIASLDPFLTKIANRSITPSYVVSNKPLANSLEALGAASEIGNTYNPSNNLANSLIREGVTKEQLWEECYKKYMASPASCTLTEIECAQEHRYLNDLMTEEEIAAFEKDQFTRYS